MSQVGAANKGFSYPIILVLVAVLAIGAGLTNKVASTLVRQAGEAELIFRATSICNAIKSYYVSVTPNIYPNSLQDLLKDPRFPDRKHLRKIYPDPFAKTDQDTSTHWQLLLNSRGQIYGVTSKVERPALRASEFPPCVELEEEGKQYNQWRFVFRPVTGSADI